MEHKKKDNFLLYHNMYAMIKDIPNEIVGDVIKSIFRYSMEGEEPKYEGVSIENLLFKHIQNSIDINSKKYYEKCEKNKKNAERRWNKKQDDMEDLDSEVYDEDEDENDDEYNEEDGEYDDSDEYVIVDDSICNRQKFEKKYAKEGICFDDVLISQKGLVRANYISRLLEFYNNKNISEESVRRFIKV